MSADAISNEFRMAESNCKARWDLAGYAARTWLSLD
jgi:hypothetical protein